MKSIDPGDRASAVPNRHFGYQQQRSRETFHKLLGAAEALIAESSFDQASVLDIATRAGVSVGAFYRRFENKEGLLQVVHERYAERMSRAIATMLEPERWAAASVEEILTAWVRAVMGTTSRNLALIRASAQRAGENSSFAVREGQIAAETFGSLARLLFRHENEIGHPRPGMAIEFAAADIGAALHQRLTMRHTQADDLDDGTWARELVLSMIAYLRVRPRP